MEETLSVSFLAVLVLSSGSASAADANWQPSTQADQWDIRYSPDMPEHPMPYGKGWRLFFPRYDGPLPCEIQSVCPSVGYVTTHAAGPLSGHSIAMTVEITGSGNFEYRLEPGNRCSSPASVRLLIQ
jgi:hypothetical protein